MADMDALIGELFASRNSLKQALALAEKAEVPKEDIAALKAALTALDSQIDSAHRIAMARGAPEPFKAVRRLVLKDDK